MQKINFATLLYTVSYKTNDYFDKK